MTPAGQGLTGLVADASVLIDHVETNRSILALISHRLGTIHVPLPVLEEVRALSDKDAAALGIDVAEPTLRQALEAQAGGGRMSFKDWLCFVVARDAGWSVLTNDMALRKACETAAIPCVWGMEAMAMLVETEHLSAARAMAVARKIARANPFITDLILDRFRDRIGL